MADTTPSYATSYSNNPSSTDTTYTPQYDENGVELPRSYDQIAGNRPANTDPSHYDEDTGRNDMPGAHDLRSKVDANSAATVEQTWKEHYDKTEQRNRYSTNNPHLSEPFSNLEALVFQALRRYGDMHPGTVDGEVMMMFVEFANLVIEDLRGHAYWDNPEIDYYYHPSEMRAIPDSIMVSGLLYHYSVQQQSNKIEAYGPMYFKMMNRILYQRKYGSGKIEMSPYDKEVRPTGVQSYDTRRSR